MQLQRVIAAAKPCAALPASMTAHTCIACLLNTFFCFLITCCCLADMFVASIRLIELCQDDPSGYSNRGYAFRKLGDYEAAVEDYSTAINLSGASSTRLHNNRAYCLAKLGRYQEAIADYDAVVGLDPDNVHAYHNRCVICMISSQLLLAAGSCHGACIAV